jgi:hypothetical protein
MHLSESLSVGIGMQGAWLGRIQIFEALIDQLPVAYQFRSRLWMVVVIAAAETLGFSDLKGLQLPAARTRFANADQILEPVWIVLADPRHSQTISLSNHCIWSLGPIPSQPRELIHFLHHT